MPQILLIIVFYAQNPNFPLGTDWVNYLFPPATQLQVNAEPKSGLFNFPNASDNEVKTCHSTTAAGQIWPKNTFF